MLPHERLVDDCDQRRSRIVGVRKVAAHHDRRADDVEVSRRDEVEVDLVQPGRDAVDRHRLAHAAALQRRHHRQRRGAHSRKRLRLAQQRLIEGDEAPRRQFGARGIDASEQHPPRLEAAIERAQALQTARKQTGAEDHDQRQRHLRDDQPPADTAAAIRRRAPASPRCRGAVADARHAGAMPNPSVVRTAATIVHDHDAQVRRDVEERDIAVGAARARLDQAGEGGAAGGRDNEAGRGTSGGQQRALDEQLADDAAPRGADRQAQRDFARARRAARQQQVRHVHTGDDQHQRDQRLGGRSTGRPGRAAACWCPSYRRLPSRSSTTHVGEPQVSCP